ncbi:MAG: hypothetical protein BWY43_00299 [candidate division WS2 bacterium ADurb.Bin280]|uniref:Uncharacterized protein n=1 Tax=candidate division WS2 bacterium ADurb.Bin280 TaxID=1852829 RepID=A0A1V5SEJ9_9BACT|nr:MAG: hypothetical protein BWY43_00299 [candidate division WS2 bacterium ADurb.Bin280]
MTGRYATTERTAIQERRAMNGHHLSIIGLAPKWVRDAWIIAPTPPVVKYTPRGDKYDRLTGPPHQRERPFDFF